MIPRLAVFRSLCSIDIRSLALFRIGLALILLCDLADRVKALTAHYTAAGVLPAAVLREYSAELIPSIHLLNDTYIYAAGLFIVAALLAVCMLIGLYTRWATVLSFLMLLSLHQRNLLLFDAGEKLLRFLLLWGMFLPLGAYASVDAWRRPHLSRKSCVFSMGSVALLSQPVILYLVAALSKALAAPWLEGRALYTALNKDELVKPFGEWLLQFPGVVEYLTYGTIVVEGLIPLMLISPWWTNRLRVGAVILNFGFQAGLWLCFNIGYFQPVMCLALVPFIPAVLWERSPRLQLPLSGTATPDQCNLYTRLAIPLETVLAGLLFMYIATTNVMSFVPGHVVFPEPIQSIGRWGLLNQRWRMFTRTDIMRQGWIVVVGQLKNGKTVDVLNRRLSVTLEKPENYESIFPSHNWRIYWSKIILPNNILFRPYLFRYLCQQWNTDIEPELRLAAIDIFFVRKIAYDPTQPQQTIPAHIDRGVCPSPDQM